MSKNGTYCRINGTIHDLSRIQDILDGKSTENISLILMDEHGMSAVDAFCFGIVLKEFCNNEIPEDYDEALERFREYNRNNRSPRAYQSEAKVKCPRCGSTDIDNYSHNLYNYKCRSCKHTWSQCPKCGNTQVTTSMSWEPNGGYNLYFKVCGRCKHRWTE